MALGITLQSLADRAISIASLYFDSQRIQPQTLSMVAEDALINVFQDVGQALADNRDTRHLLRVSQNVTFTNGSVGLPAGVLTQYASEGTLVDATDNTTIKNRYSYESKWAEFIRQWDQRLGYWTINQFTIFVIEPNTSYDPNSGLTATRVLTIPTIPQIPATASGVINYPDEVVTRLVLGTANAIIGQGQGKAGAPAQAAA